jgi:hypothetical protein
MNIRLDTDTVTPDLQRKLREVKRPRTIFEAGAKRVQVEISKHLKMLQARGNQMGWPSRGFFAGQADSVEKRVGIASMTDSGARIEIADPRFVHRITGGTVTAKRVKFLAIPLNAEAYAMSGKGSLREAASGMVVRFPFLGYQSMGGDFRKMFLLCRSVTHSPHPDEAPDVEALGVAAGKAMNRAADILLRAEA